MSIDNDPTGHVSPAADGEDALAVATLVRTLPPPMGKVIGDLSETDCVPEGIQMRFQDRTPS